MLQIGPHIKELLLHYDCVIVPGIGGFIASEIPARYDRNSQRFMPPSKAISFNVNLSHNDGLICQSIMRSKDVNYQKANDILKEEALLIREKMKLGAFLIDEVGELYLNEHGKVSFLPITGISLSKSGFGLMSFYFPELKTEGRQASANQINANQVLKPAGVRSFSRWMAAASIFLMLLLFSRPTTQYDMQNAQVGFPELDSCLETLPENGSETNVELIEDASSDMVELSDAGTSDISISAETIKMATSVPVAVSNMDYHVVIASLNRRSQADLFTLNYCLGLFKEYKVLYNGSRYRVSVKSFSSKEEAIPYLKELRESHTFYADAWLLAVPK